MKERYTYMDWAKAIGIALICIGHFLPHGYPPKVVMYAFHVPLFAFVSGLLTTAPESLLAALKKIGKLAVRILVPYTVWHWLSALLYLRLGLKTLSDAWSTWFFLDGCTIWNDALWYAPSIFLVSAVFCLLCLIIRKSTLLALGISALSLTGFVLLDTFDVTVTAFGHANLLGAHNLLLLMGFLALGYACRELLSKLASRTENPRKNPWLYGCAIAFLALLGVTTLIHKQDPISLLYGDYNGCLLFAVLAVLLVITMVPACALLPKNRIALLLSRHSLLIMCSHYFLLRLWVWEPNLPGGHETATVRFSLAVSALLLYVLIGLVADALCRRFPKCRLPLRWLGMGY